MKTKILRLALLFVVMGAGLPARALAHGAPAISVSPQVCAAGSQITVKGETMGANEDFKISLEGLTFRADLGAATSDADENMSVAFTVPTNAPAGDYQVKALSGDGDVATADLTVIAPASNAASPSTASAPPGAMPSAAPHILPHPRTPVETTSAFIVALVSAALGIVLVRRK